MIERNTKHAINHMRKMREHHDKHQAFVKRTKDYIAKLPYDNYNRTKAFHKWFTKELIEIQMADWTNDELNILIEEILEREDKYYAEAIQYHKRRLGWKVQEQQDTSTDIHWMEG